MKNRNYIPFPKATSKLASHYQYESLLMLGVSQRFYQQALKLHIKHKHTLSKIEDFYSGEAERCFAVDLELLISKYRLQDNLMIPVGNFIKTLQLEHLRDAPAFFHIFEIDYLGKGWKQVMVKIFVEPTHAEVKIMFEELKRVFRKPHRYQVATNQPLFGQDTYKIEEVDSIAKKRKHIAVIFTVEPTEEEVENLARKISKIFKQKAFHSRKKSTKSFSRNLLSYLLRKKGLNPMKYKPKELVVAHFEDTNSISKKLDKQRKETLRKGTNEIPKQFKSRFGQRMKNKIRYKKNGDIHEVDRWRNFEVKNNEDTPINILGVDKKS